MRETSPLHGTELSPTPALLIEAGGGLGGGDSCLHTSARSRRRTASGCQARSFAITKSPITRKSSPDE